MIVAERLVRVRPLAEVVAPVSVLVRGVQPLGRRTARGATGNRTDRSADRGTDRSADRAAQCGTGDCAAGSTRTCAERVCTRLAGNGIGVEVAAVVRVRNVLVPILPALRHYDPPAG